MQDKWQTQQQIHVQCLSIRLQVMYFTMPNTQQIVSDSVMRETFTDV